MTDKIKLIVTCSTAALGGAVGGFVITYIVTRGKREKAVEEALEAQRSLYEPYLPQKKESAEENKNDDTLGLFDPRPIDDTEPGRESWNQNGSLTRDPVDTHKTDYAKAAKISAEAGYRAQAEREYPAEENYRENPYLISEENFSEERMTYDKVRCMYYEQEGVMLNQDQEGFEPMDISRDVSWANINTFQDDPDLEEIFVRNDLQSTDYYITRCRIPLDEVE